MLSLSDFDYVLPPELIAQTPAAERSASRLLHLDARGALHDRQFTDLLSLLRPHDLLVFNDTRVIKARLRGAKATGGKVEVLVERILPGNRALAHVRASKTPGPGMVLNLGDAFDATVIGRDGELFLLQFPSDILTLLDAHGATPLPPYITHAADAADDTRYQTVYAREPGAVAAPTAGLHFDEATLAQMEAMGVQRAFVTLHVGAGTFQPVRSGSLADHVMHAEWYSVPPQTVAAISRARTAGGRVIAVGTTSVRALESAALPEETIHAPGPTAMAMHARGTAIQTHAAGSNRATSNSAGSSEVAIRTEPGDTRLFITPGFTFQVIDALITNFHLPQSTLLMLVSALAGTDAIRRAYAHAVAERYRFFSYGDAMFIEPATP